MNDIPLLVNRISSVGPTAQTGWRESWVQNPLDQQLLIYHMHLTVTLFDVFGPLPEICSLQLITLGCDHHLPKSLRTLAPDQLRKTPGVRFTKEHLSSIFCAVNVL